MPSWRARVDRTVSRRPKTAIHWIATALEWLPRDKHIGLLLTPGRASAFSQTVTSDVALQFANSILRRFDVDWAGLGFTDSDLDELAEHMLRIIQSFVIDPGRPPRRGQELRDYLRRWVGSAVAPPSAEPTIKLPSVATTSAAGTRTSSR